MQRLCVILLLALAFCGLADSAYIAQHESSGAPLICNVSGISGCNVVAASPYSRLFGISLADYGVLFYAIVFVLAALEIAIFDKALRRALQAAALVGLAASICFTLIQIFIIQALCEYCLTSAAIALLIFICATLIEPVRRNAFEPALPPPPVPPSSPPFRMPPSA